MFPLNVPEALRHEYEKTVPAGIREHLERVDGAATVLDELRRTIPAADASVPGAVQRAWELCGLFYMNLGRWHEATAVFHALYDHMLRFQTESGTHAHKGMPLVYLSDCYDRLACPVLAKRYLMLTACEDATRDEGQIPPETSGIYFRMVWKFGIAHQEVGRYAEAIWKVYQSDAAAGMYPEWLLQELDQQWMTEYPSVREAAHYVVTKRYAHSLLESLGKGDGKALEQLAHYLLSAIPGCRAYRRSRSYSTDYDIVCSVEGAEADFRSDWGRYFLCECKDWDKPADFTAFAKFCRVLDSTKCRFGILFSKNGITGEGKATNADREQMKVFQDRGMVVVVISQADLVGIAGGGNLIALLRTKYEVVRLDLRSAHAANGNVEK